MVANTKILLAGLQEYHSRLNQHVSQLQEEYQQLEKRWQIFSHVYEGDAAEQFRAGWRRTTEQFRDYMEQTHRISAILENRIESLREVNREEGSF